MKVLVFEVEALSNNTVNIDGIQQNDVPTYILDSFRYFMTACDIS